MGCVASDVRSDTGVVRTTVRGSSACKNAGADAKHGLINTAINSRNAEQAIVDQRASSEIESDRQTGEDVNR